jgi:hypothetical protein
MVFIKIKIVLTLKFRSKLNRIPCQYQSNVAMCHIINFLKKIFKKN